MKLEIGKRYITRNGQVTEPLEKILSWNPASLYTFIAKIESKTYTFTSEGKVIDRTAHHIMDLVEEYVDEVEQEGIRLLSEELEELSKSNHVPEIDEGEWESDFIKTARESKSELAKIEEEIVTTPDDSAKGNIRAGVTMDDIYKYLADEESGDEDSDFMKIAKNAARLLEYKNKKYGNSALNPINVFNGKSAVGQRADDKISRIQNNPTLQKNDIVDLLGYLILIIKENEWENFDEFMD